MNLEKMPQNIEAEKACLGSCLIDKDAFILAAETLVQKDFYKSEHQCIFGYMMDLLKAGTDVDLITLASILRNDDNLENVGGVIYLTRLVDSVPTSKNVEHYISLVRHASTKRKQRNLLIAVNDDKISIDDAMTELGDLGNSEVKEETFQVILENTMLNTLKGTEHIFTISSLNKYLGGLDKGELLTIGGYTSQGKSDLAIQLAIDFAIQTKRVLFLSTEMLAEEVGRRILGNMGSVNVMDLRKGLLSTEERESLEFISREIGENWKMNIKKIYDISDVNKYVRKYEPEILFLDYIQNLSGEDYRETTKNIKELQSITMRYELGTICVSQLNRNKEEIREPRLTDLRDTGRIEEVSNMVLFLYWKDRLKQENKQRFGGEPPEVPEILIAKNRDGTIGRTPVNFYPEYARLEDVFPKEYQSGMFHDKT